MARNFFPYPFAPYNGAYSALPVNDGRGNQKGEAVALDIVWASYAANGQALGAANPNYSVLFSLNTAGPNTVSGTWTVQSVYIDNEGVDFSVYIYFSDTKQAVSCPANSAGWYPVLTNQRQGLISGVGIPTKSITGNQLTRIFFTDVFMVPSLDQEIQSTVDLWLASSNISKGTGIVNTNYGAPALGDQTVNYLDDMSTPFSRTILGSPSAAGFVYITGITVNFIGVKTDGVVNLTAAAMTGSQSGQFYTFYVLGNANITPFVQVYNKSGLNLKFQSAETIQWQNTAPIVAGLVELFLEFTTNPN